MPGTAVSWAGSLVAIGGMASRLSTGLSARQLIVAVSVPSRDFAAALIGYGWVLDREPLDLRNPLETLRRMDPETPVRLVVEQHVLVDYFVEFHDSDDPRIELRNSQWQGSKIRAVAELEALEEPLRMPRPLLGSIGQWWNLEGTWDNWLASPIADLAIIGTRKWLREDLTSGIRREGGQAYSQGSGAELQANTIGGLLLPNEERAATWHTRLISSSSLAEHLPLPKEVRAAVLDGAGAIKHLTEIETSVVFCILDRSIADETAGEIVKQQRNTRGIPDSLTEDVGRRLSPGVEALAFTVAL